MDISALSDWFTETSNVKDMSGLFSSDYKLTDISALKNWSVDNVTNLSKTFENTGITSVEALSSLNTKNVTNLNRAFRAVDDLRSLSGIEAWDVSNVKIFSQTFCRDPRLTDVSAINDWNILSGTDFTHMFWLEQKDGHSTQNEKVHGTTMARLHLNKKCANGSANRQTHFLWFL